MYRERLLDDLQQEHHGICRMKSLARGYLWRPGMDTAIEQRVSSCHVFAALGKSPHKSPLHSWKWPAKPWKRIHIDFFEKDKLNFLIVIDTYYKWLEVIPMCSTTSLKTIEVLRSLFARYGILRRSFPTMGRSWHRKSSLSSWERTVSSTLAYHRTTRHQTELLNVQYRLPKWPFLNKS